MPGEVTTKGPTEAVAEAICVANGSDPERLEPGDVPYGEDDSYAMDRADGYAANGDFCHFVWREKIPAAETLITALKARGYIVTREYQE